MRALLKPGLAADSGWFVGIEGGDHNVLEGLLVDGSEYPNTRQHRGAVAAYLGDGASHDVIRSNLVKNGNASRLAVDYAGIAVSVGKLLGEDNDFNQILDNEIRDWGDGVALAAGTDACPYPGVAHGTIIDDNDIYITGAKRADCDGTPNPEGACACAENGIDIKHDPGPDPRHWTRVTNNRLWGFRPTATPSGGTALPAPLALAPLGFDSIQAVPEPASGLVPAAGPRRAPAAGARRAYTGQGPVRSRTTPISSA